MSTVSQKSPHILTVDHDTDRREGLADVLETMGYLTVCAGDGDETLQRPKDGPAPLLIVVDPAHSSSADGPFWHNRSLRTTPLLILTSQEDTDGEAMLPEAALCFQKPANTPVLLEAIASLRDRLSGRKSALSGVT